MRRLLLLLMVVSLPVWASNPGEPLDCSDWVFLEPGFSCREIAPFPCDKAVCEAGGMNFAVDNEGAILMLRWDQTASPPCGSEAAGRLELVARLETICTEAVSALRPGDGSARYSA